MNNRQYSQKPITAANAIEEYFLQSTATYGSHDNIYIDSLEAKSAQNDMDFLSVRELVWPTKEVREERTVQCSLPNGGVLETHTTTRVTRRPMTPEEAAEHFRAKAEELCPSKPVEKNPTEKKPRGRKPAATKKN